MKHNDALKSFERKGIVFVSYMRHYFRKLQGISSHARLISYHKLITHMHFIKLEYNFEDKKMWCTLNRWQSVSPWFCIGEIFKTIQVWWEENPTLSLAPTTKRPNRRNAKERLKKG
jgi:hypothetical protein